MYQRKNKDSNEDGEVISITYEDIDQIPSRVFKVKSLTALNLSHNKLSGIPQDITQLKKLQNLTVNYNLLSQLANLSKLSNLHSLSLAGNQLTDKEIDSSGLSNLHLQSLNLAKNQLNCIPKSIFSIKTLTKLVVSDNKISDIPDQFSNLINLKFLGLNNNEFKSIPKCILGLPCLKGLSISGNPFEDEVDAIYSLRNCAQIINSTVDSNAINAKIQLIQKASHNSTVIDRSNTDISDISKHVSKAIFNLPEIIPVNHHISQMSSFNRSPSATSINSHSQEDSEFFKRFRQLEEESIMSGINNAASSYSISHESLNSDSPCENKLMAASKNSSVMSLPKISSPLVQEEAALLKLEAIVNSTYDGNLNNEFIESKKNKSSVNGSTEICDEEYSRKSSVDEDQAYMIKTPTSHQANGDINDMNLQNICEESDSLMNLNKNIGKHKTQIYNMDNFVPRRKNSAVRQSLINPKVENTTNNVVICQGCNQEIGNSDYIEALNGVWHTYCFKCKKCGKVLEVTFYEVDNEPYCEQHYTEDENLYCAECKQLIVDTFIDFDGKYYHEDHFVCSKCKTTLSGKQCYIIEIENENGEKIQQVYCEQCSQENEDEGIENDNEN
ncbi:L domain-like protein [Piromyces finnis]|uniref:L domain-like protein n=1 Tax=Piromyces finnis TaxID=1754191 RepID=A0A1Y1VEF3_9FUNG|nr:L domain-like protein [Piromyces finnis]|eukprot:ORX53387.1 L domain-like protein [Piromyces finnis]